jgi:site-specific DNA-methyltransferase (adenine-specific)
MLTVDRIYTGDCIPLMQQIDDDTVNLVVTSPPYNLNIAYDVCVDRMDWDAYFRWCQLWLQEIFRILKPDGRLCLNHYLSCGTADERVAPLMILEGIAELIGFRHHGLAIWDDRTLTKREAWGSWLSARAPYVNSPYEGILILYRDHWRRDQDGETEITKKEFMEACSGIWKFQPEHARIQHPAPFPLSLPRRCVRLFSYVDNLVLDPFCGSGTTCLAAKLEGRHYLGLDLSLAYCEEARGRVTQTSIAKWMGAEA